MKTKTFFQTLFLLFLTVQLASGQETLSKISLEEAYRLLENRYPALRDAQLIQQIYQSEQSLIDKNRLPDIYLKTEGRLQSETPHITTAEGVMLPFEVDLPLYSIKSFLEAQYTFVDGGISDVQKRQKELQLAVDMQGIEVSKFALREQINRLFVNTAVLRAQEKLFDVSVADLNAKTDQAQIAVDEGILLETELDKLAVAALELKAQKDNIEFNIAGLLSSLSQLIDKQLSEDVELVFPDYPEFLDIPELQRPEQKYFDLQKQSLLAQSDMLTAIRKPKLAAFAQSGLAYPNPLNLFDNGFSAYGILGIQFNWKVADWKKEKLERDILSIQAQKILNAKESFEFNLKNTEAAYVTELEKLRKSIQNDNKIAELQKKILDQLVIQLEEGVINATEYVLQVNAEIKARQNLLVHQTELLKLQIEFWNRRGY